MLMVQMIEKLFLKQKYKYMVYYDYIHDYEKQNIQYIYSNMIIKSLSL